jgi:hypothetical protein
MARAFLLSPLLLVVAAQVSQGLVKLALYVGGDLWVLEGGGRPGISLTIHSDW